MSSKKKLSKPKKYFLARISYLDKLLFAKHLAIMIRAGLPLKQAVLSLKDQVHSRILRQIIKQIVVDLENGLSLSASLKKYQKLFGGLFISLIEIGETSGSLDEALTHLAEQIEKTYDLRKKVQAAMIYPVLILIVSLFLGGFIVFGILPKLIPFFEGLGISLPWSTRLILWLAYFVKNNLLLLLVIIGFLFIGLPLISRWRPIKKINHYLFISLPLINKMVCTVNLGYFSRILAVLLKAGLPFHQALQITAQATNNLSYQKHINNAASFVEKGKSLSDYLTLHGKVFPKTVSQLIRAAENSGKLEETLFYLAEFYEKESSRRLEDITNIVSPVLLLIIGLLVALLALGVISAIYQMTKEIKFPGAMGG